MNPQRAWLYFRHGYAYYFAMAVSGMNTLILLYFMVGDKVEQIRIIFPHFFYFAGFAIAVGVPLLIIIGWTHYKKSYKSEAEILFENNPSFYKLLGKDFVMYQSILSIIKSLPEPMNHEQRKQRQEIIDTLETLLRGESIVRY